MALQTNILNENSFQLFCFFFLLLLTFNIEFHILKKIVLFCLHFLSFLVLNFKWKICKCETTIEWLLWQKKIHSMWGDSQNENVLFFRSDDFVFDLVVSTILRHLHLHHEPLVQTGLMNYYGNQFHRSWIVSFHLRRRHHHRYQGMRALLVWPLSKFAPNPIRYQHPVDETGVFLDIVHRSNFHFQSKT